MGKYSRAEIEEAFAKFQATAAEAGVTGDWRAWSECFTEDVEYYEHHYGRMHGRAQVLDWINTTMAESINKDMSSFPIAWTMIDEDNPFTEHVPKQPTLTIPAMDRTTGNTTGLCCTTPATGNFPTRKICTTPPNSAS